MGFAVGPADEGVEGVSLSNITSAVVYSLLLRFYYVDTWYIGSNMIPQFDMALP